MARKKSKTTKFFSKIGGAVLEPQKLPGNLKRRMPKIQRKTKSKPKHEVPGFLQGFFERRHAGWPEYVMLKAQLAMVPLFLAAAAFIMFRSSPEIIFAPIIAALIGYLIYLTPTQLKPAFGRDYPAYRAFVGLCVGIVLALILTLRYLPLGISLTSPYPAIIPVVLVVGLVFGGFGAFKLRYGRDYTYGIVEGARGNKVAVLIGYDLRSNVKHGLHFLDSLVRVKRGDRVKVGVERSAFGLRGMKPKAVLEKVKR